MNVESFAIPRGRWVELRRPFFVALLVGWVVFAGSFALINSQLRGRRGSSASGRTMAEGEVLLVLVIVFVILEKGSRGKGGFGI